MMALSVGSVLSTTLASKGTVLEIYDGNGAFQEKVPVVVWAVVVSGISAGIMATTVSPVVAASGAATAASDTLVGADAYVAALGDGYTWSLGTTS